METVHQSPLDDAFVQDPYRFYAEVLKGDPIRYWQDYGMAAAFDAATIQTLLRDRRLGRARPDGTRATAQTHLVDFDAVERHSMLDLEPPRHTRLRGLVLRAFTSRRIKAMAPDIRDISDALIAKLPDGPFDLIKSYCQPLPVRVIARLLGVPEEMSPQLLAWSNAMVAMYMAGKSRATEDAANRAAREFSAFLSDYIEKRRGDPRDDLITHLIAAEEEGTKLTRDEMIGTCILLLNAGHEATVHTLGNGVKCLLEYNTPKRALSDAHIAATVEEILRFDPPLHMFTRYAYEDIQLGGHMLKQGQEIALVLGSAGRDPHAISAAQTFDPFRSDTIHAAFGAGLHFCLGAPLARLEMQIGLQRLFEQKPAMRLTETPRFAQTYHFHGLESLMVET